MKKIHKPEDLFKATNMTNESIPEEYEEVQTLFCDSSGFGAPDEPALTQQQAIARTNEILSENKENTLYAAITDAGQFQVYVGIFKKVSK